MTDVELGKLKDVLVSQGVVPATASDGDVAAAHAAMLQGPHAAQYKSALVAGGLPELVPGPNWLVLLGLAGGAVAVYFIWKHYQKEQVGTLSYPDPAYSRHQMRDMGKALGAFRMGNSGKCSTCGPRIGRLGSHKKYQFEPETRLEGIRKRKGAR